MNAIVGGNDPTTRFRLRGVKLSGRVECLHLILITLVNSLLMGRHAYERARKFLRWVSTHHQYASFGYSVHRRILPNTILSRAYGLPLSFLEGDKAHLTEKPVQTSI